MMKLIIVNEIIKLNLFTVNLILIKIYYFIYMGLKNLRIMKNIFYLTLLCATIGLSPSTLKARCSSACTVKPISFIREFEDSHIEDTDKNDITSRNGTASKHAIY